jgi:S1-C subfamily serine protease
VKSIVGNIENHDAVNGIILGESPFLGIFEQPTTGFGGFGFSFGNSGNSGATGSSGAASVGVTIGGVTTGGPAANAGLASGDVITSIDGQKTGSWPSLEKIVAARSPGSPVKLSYVDSNGNPHTVTVTLGGIPK